MLRKTFSFQMPLPPTMNDIIQVARQHKFAANAQKKKWGGITQKAIEKERNGEDISFVDCEPYIHFSWMFSNKKRDRDNIEAARKFILDGMISAGLLKDDSFDAIADLSRDFAIGADNVLVTISTHPIIKWEFVDYPEDVMPEEYAGLVL